MIERSDTIHEDRCPYWVPCVKGRLKHMITTSMKYKMIRRPTGSLHTIGKVIFAGLLLLVLPSCDVLRESDTDTGIGGKGVMAGDLQPHIGRGSPSDWNTATCAVVEGRTQWKWLPPPKEGSSEDDAGDPYIFHIDKPLKWTSEGKLGDVLITLLPLSSCQIDDQSTIAYTTKDWLCVDDYVRVNDNDCLIKSIKEL